MASNAMLEMQHNLNGCRIHPKQACWITVSFPSPKENVCFEKPMCLDPAEPDAAFSSLSNGAGRCLKIDYTPTPRDRFRRLHEVAKEFSKVGGNTAVPIAKVGAWDAPETGWTGSK